MKRMLTALLVWGCISSSLAQVPKHRKPTPSPALLQGIWAAEGKDENALFWVEGNRLTYVEFADEHLRYTLTPPKQKLTIFRPDGPPDVYYIKKLTRDSLVIMVGNMGPIWRLYRR
jgi:hypothetical protein